MVNNDSSVLYRLDILNQQQTRVNYQMSSGKVLDKGSDDTKVYTQDLFLNDKIRTYEGLQTQLEKTTAQNDVADSSLAEIKNLLDYVKSETIKGRNDTNDAISRKAIAVQIEGTKENLFMLANERVEDEYIFSGSRTNEEAFVQDSDGKVTYNGNPHLRKAAVEVDAYRDRGVTGLDVMHYDVKTVGPEQTMTFEEGEIIIDSEGYEWKLNEQESVLIRHDEDGESTTDFVEVTFTGATPNKEYEVADTGINTFTVKHSTFDVLDDIITALNDNDMEALSASIDDINSAYNAANHAHGELGGRNATFEDSYERIQSKLTHYNVLMVENSSADLTKVALEAKQLEITYTSLYSTINKMNSLSLVNFIN